MYFPSFPNHSITQTQTLNHYLPIPTSIHEHARANSPRLKIKEALRKMHNILYDKIRSEDTSF